jgi:FkbM family methyltransferase
MICIRRIQRLQLTRAKIEETMSSWRRWLVGLAMRLYRRSPLHPTLGPILARTLAKFTRGERESVTVQEVDGLRYELDLREVIDASLYYGGSFEPYAEKILAEHLAPGMVAIDVGANMGYHTLRMARSVADRGRVLAVEPTAWAFKKLLRNIGLNPFLNIVPLQVGLGDGEHGWAECLFRSSYRLDSVSSVAAERVWMTTLDRVVQEHAVPRVHLIKIDVDGFEGRVFRGAVETLRRDRPVLFFECDPAGMKRLGDATEELFDQLDRLGYRLQGETGDAVSPAIFREPNRLRHTKNLLALPH